MDLDFRVILEPSKDEEKKVSPETQLTVAYMRALREGNMRQAPKILDEKELIEKADQIRRDEKTANLQKVKKLSKISEYSRQLLKELSKTASLSISLLEDTLNLRSDLYRIVKSDSNMSSKRFIVANNYLEDTIIKGACSLAPLIMIKESLKDMIAISDKDLSVVLANIASERKFIKTSQEYETPGASMRDISDEWRGRLEGTKRRAIDPSPPGLHLPPSRMGYEYDEDVLGEEHDITDVLAHSGDSIDRALHHYMTTGEEIPLPNFEWPSDAGMDKMEERAWLKDMVQEIVGNWAYEHKINLLNVNIVGDPPRILARFDV